MGHDRGVLTFDRQIQPEGQGQDQSLGLLEVVEHLRQGIDRVLLGWGLGRISGHARRSDQAISRAHVPECFGIKVQGDLKITRTFFGPIFHFVQLPGAKSFFDGCFV